MTTEFKDRIVRIYRRIRYPWLGISGMMGDEERLNLFKLARNDKSKSGIAIEFGAFFGASTSAIQAGFLKTHGKKECKEFYVIDSFSSRISSSFSDHVRQHAKSKKQDHLLIEDNGYLDFYNCFIANIGSQDNISIFKGLLSDFSPPDKTISFMHLDLPKEWSQLKIIIESCFRNLEQDSMVLFQDYAYHWSSELIAAVGFMIKNRNIDVINIVDTTLSAKVVKRFSNEDISELVNLMSDNKNLLIGLNYARDHTFHLFSEENVATFDIALAQLYYFLGRKNEAYKLLSMALSRNTDISRIASKVAELLNNQFELDRSYE